MPFPIIAAAGLVGGLVKGLFGGKQRREAKKLLAAPRPEYNIPQEILQNKGMAEQLSGSGLPSAQYAQAQQNIQRQQNSAIQAAQTRRGGLGLIGNIQQRTNDATLGLDVQNAKMKVQNMQNLMGVNNQVAGYRDKAFQLNKLQPYEEQRAYGMSLMGAGNQNIAGGIDTALGGIVSQYGGGMSGGFSSGSGLFGRSRRKSNTPYPDYFGLNSGTDY